MESNQKVFEYIVDFLDYHDYAPIYVHAAVIMAMRLCAPKLSVQYGPSVFVPLNVVMRHLANHTRLNCQELDSIRRKLKPSVP